MKVYAYAMKVGVDPWGSAWCTVGTKKETKRAEPIEIGPLPQKED